MIWLRRLSYGLIALCLLGAAALLWYRNATLPQIDGRVVLQGIAGPVDVVRDRTYD